MTIQILPHLADDVAMAAGGPHGCQLMHGAPFHYGVADDKRTRKATALNCTFRTRYVYVGYDGDLDAPRRIFAHDKHRVFLAPKTTGVPELKYNTKFCKEIPLPNLGAGDTAGIAVVGEARSRAGL